MSPRPSRYGWERSHDRGPAWGRVVSRPSRGARRSAAQRVRPAAGGARGCRGAIDLTARGYRRFAWCECRWHRLRVASGRRARCERGGRDLGIGARHRRRRASGHTRSGWTHGRRTGLWHRSRLPVGHHPARPTHCNGRGNSLGVSAGDTAGTLSLSGAQSHRRGAGRRHDRHRGRGPQRCADHCAPCTRPRARRPRGPRSALE